MAELPPKPTELVYMPKPSWAPAFVALGLALVIVGLFVWWPYSVAGAIIGLVAIIAWVRETARETARLPVEQPTSSAVLPARGSRPASGTDR